MTRCSVCGNEEGHDSMCPAALTSPREEPLIEPAPWPWRLPIVRHIRAIWHAWQIVRWEDHWRSMGMIPQGFDKRVVQQMWKGIV